MNTTNRLSILLTSILGLACSRSTGPAVAPPSSETDVADWSVCGNPLDGDAQGLSAECQNLRTATQVARSLLASPEFFAVLEKQPEVYASKRGAKAKTKLVPSELKPLLVNGPPAASVDIGDAYGRKSTASTSNVARTITVDECNHGSLALECAGGTVPARLVATMVHEQIHLYSDADGRFAFTDGGRRFDRRATLFSYMAGNIALCLLSAGAANEADVATHAAECMATSRPDAFGNLQVKFDDPCVPIPSHVGPGSVEMGAGEDS